MNPKQRLAYKKAAEAISELCRTTVGDAEAYNDTLALLSRALGAAIGTACGAHSMSVEHLYSATTTAAQEMQKEAAKCYGSYLAMKRGSAGNSNEVQ